MQLSLSKHLGLVCLLAAAGITASHAQTPSAKPTPQAKYEQECTGCHIAYPVGMLPAPSWQRIMSTLSKHYGADASLDDASTREIGNWLKAGAGTYKRVDVAPEQDRLSKSDWFLRKHRAGEVAPEVWTRPAVGSPSNCAACHPKAAQGSFNERDIKIPK